MKELIGSTIQEVWIDDDEQIYMKFKTDKGEFVYFASGDCCSESWFNDVDGVDCLIGHKVLQVKTIMVEDHVVIRNSRQEEDEIQTIVIVTDAGIADIIFRNSSNGYYGGECEFVKEKDYEWHEKIEKHLIKLTADYSADTRGEPA